MPSETSSKKAKPSAWTFTAGTIIVTVGLDAEPGTVEYRLALVVADVPPPFAQGIPARQIQTDGTVHAEATLFAVSHILAAITSPQVRDPTQALNVTLPVGVTKWMQAETAAAVRGGPVPHLPAGVRWVARRPRTTACPRPRLGMHTVSIFEAYIQTNNGRYIGYTDSARQTPIIIMQGNGSAPMGAKWKVTIFDVPGDSNYWYHFTPKDPTPSSAQTALDANNDGDVPVWLWDDGPYVAATAGAGSSPPPPNLNQHFYFIPDRNNGSLGNLLRVDSDSLFLTVVDPEANGGFGVGSKLVCTEYENPDSQGFTIIEVTPGHHCVPSEKSTSHRKKRPRTIAAPVWAPGVYQVYLQAANETYIGYTDSARQTPIIVMPTGKPTWNVTIANVPGDPNCWYHFTPADQTASRAQTALDANNGGDVPVWLWDDGPYVAATPGGSPPPPNLNQHFYFIPDPNNGSLWNLLRVNSDSLFLTVVDPQANGGLGAGSKLVCTEYQNPESQGFKITRV